MSDPIQVIDALCRLLQQAISLIKNESERFALEQAFDEALGEENER